MKKINRRDFLAQSSAAAALVSAPGFAYTQGFGAAAPFTDYRALVCVFLHGGNDSFNMLVPNTTAEYNAYAASRQNLAIPQTDLLPINPPTTKTQFENQSVILPSQLFSHNDQQSQWHSLKGANTSKTGWAGRMADLIQAEVANQRMATNASVSGNSPFLSAANTIAYVMGQDGPLQFEGFSDDPTSILFDQRMAFQGVLDAQYDSIYERGFAGIQSRAVAAADSVSAAITNAETSGVITTTFPSTPLGSQLSTVAKLIASRAELDMQRQIFFVGTGSVGWCQRCIGCVLQCYCRYRRRWQRNCFHAIRFRTHVDIQWRWHGSRLGRKSGRSWWCREWAGYLWKLSNPRDWWS